MSSHQRPRNLSTYLNTSRQTIIEMLNLRGFDTSNLMQFSAANSNMDTMLEPIKLSNGSEYIEIHYELTSTRTNHKNLSKKVQQIMEKTDPKNIKKDFTIIFLVSDTMTPSVKEAVRVLANKYKVYIQVFPIKTLMYNVTKHNFVPEHIRIKKDEYSSYLEDFLDSHHINSLENLPKILESDPVAMFIGLRPGELAKIIRPSTSAGQHIVYRYCVQDK